MTVAEGQLCTDGAGWGWGSGSGGGVLSRCFGGFVFV